MADTHKYPPFFWLHIKKNGGGTIRRLLTPEYVLAERSKRPVNFIQSDRALHNDILNNYRMPLGEYQFKRAQFAKSILFSDIWNDIPRFAFLRHPVERAVSAFHYLSKRRGTALSFIQARKSQGQRIASGLQDRFDLFLELIAESQASNTHSGPVNLHFAAHVNPVWNDISDCNGNNLLSHLYRLENMISGIEEIFQICEIDRQPNQSPPIVNAFKGEEKYQPTRKQIRAIEEIYSKDFDLFENTGGLSLPKPANRPPA